MLNPEISDAGLVTGTADTDYDLIRFTETCLRDALRLEGYIEDARRAGDEELEWFFARAQSTSVRNAREGKALLGSRCR